MSDTLEAAAFQATYSINYRVRGYDSEAADWDYLENKGCWSVSETSGVRYYPHGKNSFLEDPSAYIAVLEHFGLLEFWNEYEIREVMFMSPRRLAYERRRHEEQNPNLRVKPKEEIVTHNAPHELYAEDYIERVA